MLDEAFSHCDCENLVGSCSVVGAESLCNIHVSWKVYYRVTVLSVFMYTVYAGKTYSRSMYYISC